MSFRKRSTVGASVGLCLLVLILAVEAASHGGFSQRSNAADVMMTTAAASAPGPNKNGSGSSSGGKGAVFDLRQLGAKGDGSSDDTQVSHESSISKSIM